jgi:hypothetical protein
MEIQRGNRTEMTDRFWSQCKRAIEAYAANDVDVARRLLAEAQASLVGSSLDAAMLAKRRQHLRSVRAYVDPGSVVDEREPQPVATEHSSEAQTAEIMALQQRVERLEAEKSELSRRLVSLPSIDPLCVVDTVAPSTPEQLEPFGIALFGHTRLGELKAVLESLKKQDALQYTEVWLDGHQGNPVLKQKVTKTFELVQGYPVKRIHRQNGQFAFRKLLILGLSEMCGRYRDILVLEDDCFPTGDAVAQFQAEIEAVRSDPRIFSVYGHHFLTDSEGETCNRFQGWGWATTSEKLAPVLRQLIDCYSMTEKRYLEFVSLALTSDIRARIDVTPPRQPTHTLERFFAWDETLCLLTAMNDQVHKPTRKRTIYNCGMSKDSTHFANSDRYRMPPYNLITPDEVWRYF